MDIKKTFLKLTQWTIPHGYEETISHLLPSGMQKDEIGNYFISIGKSETLFTCHLDTVSNRMKVNHIIQGDIIRTDGNSILGGDNKAGVCILMYLIEQGVPGTYYFFVGEETGCIGSRWALKNNQDYFKKFKRAVAFDRKKYGSIITKQRGSVCASDDFAKALSQEYVKMGLKYQPDDTGVYTDTAVFVGVIPECTNISSAVFGEHTKDEHINIKYLTEIAIASAKIQWEKLPTKRVPVEEVKIVKTSNRSYTEDYYSEYNAGYYNHKTASTNRSSVNTSNVEYVNGTGLKFNEENISKYFQLQKVEYSDEVNNIGGSFFGDDAGDIWNIRISNEGVSIYKELASGVLSIVYFESLENHRPKSFVELWNRIKDIVPFKRRVKSNKNSTASIKEVKKPLTLIVDDTITLDKIQKVVDNDIRFKMDVVAYGPTKAPYKKYYEINLIFPGDVDFEVINVIVDSAINRFKTQLKAIVNPTKIGSTVNGVQQTNIFKPNLTIDSFYQKFDVKINVINDDSVSLSDRFKDFEDNCYTMDIKEGNNISIYLISSNKVYHLIFTGVVKSWEDFYSKIKDKVVFKLKNDNDAYSSKFFTTSNFDKAFELVKIGNGDFYRDVKGNEWQFVIYNTNSLSIYLKTSSIQEFHIVVRLLNVNSFAGMLERFVSEKKNIDQFDITHITNLMNTFKLSLIDEEEEEEEE